MAIEFSDWEEIEENISAGGFKQANLSTANGVPMLPYNSHKISLDSRLKDIKARLDNVSTEDGAYIIRARYHNTDKKPAEFYYQKGNINNIALADQAHPAQVVPAQFIAPPVPQALPQDLTTEQILKMYQENARWKAEVEHLKEENARLIQELDECYEELDGMAEGPSDQAQFWSSIAENLVPVLDQHYAYKRDELAYNRQQLAAQLMGAPQQVPPGQMPPQQMAAAPQQMQPANNQQDVQIEALPLHPSDKQNLYNMKVQNPQLFATTLAKLQSHFANENNAGNEVGQ